MLDQSLLVALIGASGTLAVMTLILRRVRKGTKVDPIECNRVQPLSEGEQQTESPIIPSSGETERAKNELKRLTLEREITASTMKSIYEAEVKGAIDTSTRDKMLEKYKIEIKRLDGEIAQRRRATEFFDLKAEREQLARRLGEIEERLELFDIPADCAASTSNDEKPITLPVNESSSGVAIEKPQSQEHEDRIKAMRKTEERIEEIRAEVLRAMEKLEKIEAEG